MNANQTECLDVDQCLNGDHDCASGADAGDIDAICKDLTGDHECSCPDGYSGTGYVGDACISLEVDECTVGHNCSQHANCTDTFLSYTCECQVRNLTKTINFGT